MYSKQTAQSLNVNLDWERVLSFDIKQAYPEFIDLLERCMQGNVPMGVSPRKRRNIYLTAEANKIEKQEKKNYGGGERIVTTNDSFSVINELRTLTRSLEHHLKKILQETSNINLSYSGSLSIQD